MKKILIWFLGALVVLSSCAQIGEEPKDDNEKENLPVLGSQSSEETYRMITPYKTGAARGRITTQISNRVDIDELEVGLRRHSMDVFDPSEFYFQEGQYLSDDTIINWIAELNPARKDNWSEKKHRENPRVFSHVLEQNYLKRVGEKEVELAGISIGIALKSVYSFQAPLHGESFTEEIDMNRMMRKGYEVAQRVVDDIRELEGLSDIPIMIALYRESEPSSPIPGNYVARTIVTDKNTITNWETIDEEYILFPSEESENKHLEEHENVKRFGDKIAQYFPNYTGLTGSGFSTNKQLQTLSIEIPIELFGNSELTGFMQHVSDLVYDIFDNYYDIEIKVTSSNETIGHIYRKAGDESLQVYIYH